MAVFISVPIIIRGRIVRQFKKTGAIGFENAKSFAELDMDKPPFTRFGAKKIFERLQQFGVIKNDGDRYYLVK